MKHEQYEHGPLVEAWLKEPTSLGESDTARIAQLVHQTSQQQRSWLPHIDTGRFGSMFSATKFVAAGVIVALFGGFLLAGALTQQGEESAQVVGASPSSLSDSMSVLPVMLPAEIPAEMRSGTLDTPLGPARWVHLDGNEALQDLEWIGGGAVGMSPGSAVYIGDQGLLVATPDGYAITTGFNHGEPRRDNAVWRSPDLLTWTSSPMSVQAVEAGLWWAGGSLWLGTAEPATLWRSGDAEDWSETSLDMVVPPHVPGMRWKTRVGTPVASGSTTMVPVLFEATNVAAYLGLPDEHGECVRLTPAESADSAVHAEGCYGEPITTLTFEELEGGLRVLDADEGTIYSELKGVDMDFIDAWVTRERPRDRAQLQATVIAVVDGDELTPVGSPMPPFAETRFFGGEAGFVAYQQDTRNELIRVWHSDDGVAWTGAEPLGDGADEPSSRSYRALRPRPDRIEALDPEAGIRWSSTDGLTWEADKQIAWRQEDYDFAATGSHPWPAAGGMVNEDDVPRQYTRVAGGFVGLSGGDYEPIEGVGSIVDIESLLVQVDGSGETTAIDVTGLGLQTDDTAERDQWRVPFDAISGNTLVLAQERYWDESPGEQHEAWIITFDDLPA